MSTVCHCTYSSERQNQQPAEQRGLGINFFAVGQFLVGTNYPKEMFMFDDGGSELDCGGWPNLVFWENVVHEVTNINIP